MICINSEVVFLCDPSFRASDRVSKHVYGGVERSGPARGKDERVKGIKGAGKPEKFIKRFLSWHRRTSVSDLLAPANDPTCPQEDSPGVRLVANAVDGSVRQSSKLPWNADGYHSLFARYPSELSSPPLPSASLIDLHSIGEWTPPASSFSRILPFSLFVFG